MTVGSPGRQCYASLAMHSVARKPAVSPPAEGGAYQGAGRFWLLGLGMLIPAAYFAWPYPLRGNAPRLARRSIESSERLGRHRWIVERSRAWLLGCRRLGVRYERRVDLLQGLLHLACTLVCVRFLPPIA